jgi:hypothetical protein
MSSTASALPALAPNADTRSITQRINAITRNLYNRVNQDLFLPTFAVDAGSATAYAITVNAAVTAYVEGQVYAFKAANSNSGSTPTLNVNGLGAGTITWPDGSPLAANAIIAGGFYFVQCTSTTPTFALLNGDVGTTSVTTFLGSDVALNNTGSFFNGPNTGSIGAAGQTWLIIAGGAIDSGSGATTAEFALYNGSSYIADLTGVGAGAGWPAIATVAVVVTLAGPTTFTLRAKANTTSAFLRTTGLSSAVANKATFITAVRLA